MDRVDRIKRIIKDNQAALITSNENVFYLGKLEYTDGAILITPKGGYLLADFRYAQVAKENVFDLEVVIFDSLYKSIKEICIADKIDEVLIENEKVTIAMLKRMENAFAENKITVVTSSLLSRKLINLRMIKTSQEIEYIKKAQQIAEYAYIENLNFIKAGVTQREIALNIEFLMRKKGASKVAFDLITISGDKTSLPHGVPDDTPVKDGDFITMDIGAVYNGYHSDMTRTIALKSVNARQEEIYNIVLEAQTSTLKAVKAGVSSTLCDKIARDIISKAGYAKYFKHSTGHGVGLEIHEEPRLSTTGETILSSGMVITVEPGIYLPQEFGVRIEDMICVTKDGYDNFATISKELTII